MNTKLNMMVNVTARSEKYQKAIQAAEKKTRALLDTQSRIVVNSKRMTKSISNGLNTLSTEVVRFNGNLLSTLFFGMELKRIFGGALKSIFEGYKKILPEGGRFNQLTTQLSANWEFFKFQMADALANSPLFQKLIATAINFLKVLQNIPAPIKEIIGWLLIIGTAIGGILMVTGVWGLGLAGIINMYAAISAKVAALGGSVSGFTWGAIVKATPFIAVIAALAMMGVYMDKFYKSSELGENASNNLKKALMDTVNSALIPMFEAFGQMGFQIKDFNELVIGAGVIGHNFFLILGMVVDAVIALGRTLMNVITMALSPYITAIKIAAEAMQALLSGDFAGAATVGMSAISRLTDSLKKDMSDIADTALVFAENLNFKFNALEGFRPAVDAYRAEMALSAVGQEVSQDRSPLASYGPSETQQVQQININLGEENIYSGSGADELRESVRQIMEEAGFQDIQKQLMSGK